MSLVGRALILTLTLWGNASIALAQESWRDFPGVSNSAYVDPNGDRAIQLSIEVPGSREAVFDAYATTDGFTSWAVPVALIDLRIGGISEASYDGGARIGDPNNIRNEIVAFVPGRLLVLRNVQAPATFIDADLFQRTVIIVEFVELDASRTRVTITNAGYGSGERFDRLYRQFEWANAYTLEALRERFERGPIDWNRSALAAADAASQRIEHDR